MPELEGTKTHENLKAAFARESQANRRYLYFAQRADVEGHPDLAALFRSVSEGKTGYAFGHLDFLADIGDPVTGEPVGSTADNLKSAIAGNAYGYAQLYPGFARTARDEGLNEIAEWLEVLARSERRYAGCFTSARVALLGGLSPKLTISLTTAPNISALPKRRVPPRIRRRRSDRDS